MEVEVEGILNRAFPRARILNWAPLAGGVSARALRVELELETGETKHVVVRRPTCPTIEERRRVARSEYRVLASCKRADIAVPTPCFLAVDEAGVVLEYIDAAVEFAPQNSPSFLRPMAEQLARIHAISVAAEFDFLPRREQAVARNLAEPPEQLDHALNEPYLRDVLRELWPWPRNRDCLLHGDYWPGNVLWRDERLAAVIDWEEAAIGDPLADVAITRLDLWWAFGESAMHEFTAYYREHSGLDWSSLPAWDLLIALRPMSNLHRWATAYQSPPIARPDITYETMRDTHARFTQQALESLGRA